MANVEHDNTEINSYDDNQYERMQDIITAYSQLAVKTITAISAGALVAISAAFVNFLSIENSVNTSAIKLMKTVLTSSFSAFSLALLLALSCIASIYFSRLAFLINTDIRYCLKCREFCMKLGYCLEWAAVVILSISFYQIFCGLKALQLGFEQFPLQ